jgi:hypothetical protein
VKPELHWVNRFDPAVTGEQGIERPAQRSSRPTGRGTEADALTNGVYAGIGPPGGMGNGPAGKEPLQDALELDLDRTAGGLALPPDKAGAVIV